MWRATWDRLLGKMLEKQGLDWGTVIDGGAFHGQLVEPVGEHAQERGNDAERGHRRNGTRNLLKTNRQGTPLITYTTAAHLSEVNTIETLVEEHSASLPAPERPV